ncbi:MAG: DUF362 domain-containing protein [Endomicrobium sp.]|nr:DUF362 domain-containing protein [Endomicrobium sp.]
MSSKVYFLPWKRRGEIYEFLKAARVFNHVKARNFLAVKIHFGEEKNTGYIKPEYVKPVIDILKEKTAFPYLTDCSTIYVGKRADAYHHLLVANKHGFNIESCGCPIIIGDGLRGNNEVEIEVNKKHFKSVLIGADIAKADAFIFMNHFKGHEVTGFGGALKNIGMGCGAKAGKFAMHHTSKPHIHASKCIACGSCVKNCAQGALVLDGKKITMDKNKCAGCGQCLVSCSKNVFGLDWNEGPNALQERIVEYAAGVLKDKKASYINFVNHISKFCDCFDMVKNEPLMDDVGIVAGSDPVAVDQASYDLTNKTYGKNFFREIYPDIDPEVQLEYACNLGLGTRDYEVVNYK